MGKRIISVKRYVSPCGELILGASGSCLCLCDWAQGTHSGKLESLPVRGSDTEIPDKESAVIDDAARQLDEYFAGERREFDIPLDFAGTEFQRKVWKALMEIPYGTTVSYGELARRIGRPSSVRAVANAVGANAISIFVPCHRVIGSNGSLTGYDGGLAAKSFLLALEAGQKL